MPNIEEHCQHALKRYGVEGRDIHQWLDEPSRKYASGHRQFRHDTEMIKLVGEIFGKKYGKSVAETMALDHIMLDHEEEIKRRRTLVLKFPEKKEIPSIPCSYCGTLLKPSDQACPNCGATRKRIIEEFDRAYEMEKIKHEEMRRELRKELKRELELRKMTPERRILLWKISRNIPPGDPLLEKLVQEDFEKYPELKERFDKQISPRIFRLIYVCCLLICLFPCSVLWIFGYLGWAIVWGVASFVIIALILSKFDPSYFILYGHGL